MKENKINVELIVPSVGQRYSLFIPVNKTVGEVIKILNNIIDEITGCFPQNNHLCILDVFENVIYNSDVEIINSGMKNGSLLALI